MARQQWSGRDLIIMANGTFPLKGLSDADDAVIVEDMNPLYEDPHFDLTGENAVHVKNETKGLRITLKFKIGANASLTYLDGIKRAGRPLISMTGKNLGSNTSNFVGENVALVERGQWGGGKNPVEPTIVFIATKGDFAHGGQRTTV